MHADWIHAFDESLTHARGSSPHTVKAYLSDVRAFTRYLEGAGKDLVTADHGTIRGWLGTLAVDRFLLEYDDERSGTFEPLRFVPRGKTVVLGLISSKRSALESKRELIRRIEEAARYVPLDNLALSPQCGFASTMEGNLLSEDDQWAKLRLVAETAREVWQGDP